MSLPANVHSIQTMYQRETGLHAAFDYVHGRTPYEKTVLQLNRLGPKALTVLGDVHLQEAIYMPGRTDELLDKATLALEERVYSNEMGFDPQAAIRLAQMPLYRSLLGNPKFPDRKDVADTYNQILWAASTAVNHYLYRDEADSYHGGVTLGVMAEAATLLLATRFTLKNDLAEDWLPVQASIAEDFGPGQKRSGWDMSVYLPGRKNRPTLGYKVQVKSRQRENMPYNRDIAVVSIHPDLALKREVMAKSTDIILDLQQEANVFASSVTATERIESRTHKLLTIMDRAK